MWQPTDPQPQSQVRSHMQESQGEQFETRSRCSGSSKSSRSSASVAALKARAKAGAVQVQLAYAEEEAEAMKQQAEIQAQLHILKVKKEAAAAAAEADILEAATQYEEQQPLCQERLSDNSVDPRQRVQNYIDNQVFLPDNQMLTQPPILSTNSIHQDEIPNADTQPIPLDDVKLKTQQQQSPVAHNHTSIPEPRSVYPAANYQYQPFSSSPFNAQQTSNSNDVAKYLMRRELVTGTMQKFDDDPQNYRGWKS
ncbi:uncharacterized protein LOC117524691 [Thalassophryne amazonica]|uniref:uncharacterized protein LOC117524691 n=1 Tax=Thalassophryne amazonica TaxID=390379 RepID=UPI00147112A7|nr:uncharacterized protein LOC117524691 [Thalassophryne amazonica]